MTEPLFDMRFSGARHSALCMQIIPFLARVIGESRQETVVGRAKTSALRSRRWRSTCAGSTTPRTRDSLSTTASQSQT